MNVVHYRVFAAAPGGGKHIAVTEAENLSTAEMQTIARESGAPLTGFILGEDNSGVLIRFFTQTKEKLESDSGALVVAEHRWRKGLVEVFMRASMNGDILPVSGVGYGGYWFSEQGRTSAFNLEIPERQLLDCLGLNLADLNSDFVTGMAGANKKNMVVAVKNSKVLDELKPDLDALKKLNLNTNTNGLIVFAPDQTRGADFDLRFFAPAKGILEDNAGSFTIASLCGFLVASLTLEGQHQLQFSQGYAMAKPSKLEAKFDSIEGNALKIRVGGAVERIEP
jgi:PhzF family phenazine biosynthesis protein